MVCVIICDLFLCCIYGASGRGQERVDPSGENKANFPVVCVCVLASVIPPTVYTRLANLRANGLYN